MEKLLVGREVEAILEVSKKTLGTFSACGFLNPQVVGAANIYDPEEVAVLAEVKSNQVAQNAPPAWVVRLGEPGKEPDGHPTGWLVGRENNVDAARMYWRVTHSESSRNHALVALVGPLVVGVWNIVHGIFHEDIPPYGRTEFIVEAPRPDQRAAYEGRWLNLGRGATVLRWPRPAESRITS